MTPRPAVLGRPLRIRDRAYRLVYSRAIFPAYHGLLRDGASAANREVAHVDRLDPEAYRRFCVAKLDKLMEHVARNVPYYRGRLQDCGVKPESAPRSTIFSVR